MAEHPSRALASRLETGRPVVVQTHDYPDIDAVASAWALATLLETRGFSASCRYRGELRSRSLRILIDELGIGLAPASDGERKRQLIVVDGSPENGNVSLAPGKPDRRHRPSLQIGRVESPPISTSAPSWPPARR